MKKIIILMVLLICFSSVTVQAKVYIDITSPGARQIPIAVVDFEGEDIGRQVADIIRSDLDYSGFFRQFDKSVFVEKPNQSFDAQNWKPLGVELVVKGTVETITTAMGKVLKVNISVFDVFSSTRILTKSFQARESILRLVSHKAANSVYESITGLSGVFDTKIAFVADDLSNRYTNKKYIYIMDWDGERVRKVTDGDNIVMRPHWSPDGLSLAYTFEKSKRWGINLIDLKTLQSEILLISQAANITGDFAPDGENLLISSSIKGISNIYRLNTKSKTLSPLSSTYNIETSPSTSSSGSEIVYVSDQDSTPQIFIMDKEGNNKRRVTFSGSYNTSPNFSYSGEKIVYSAIIGGKFQVMMINKDGTNMVQLTSEGNNEEPYFSPDGRYVVFTSDRFGNKSVFITRNDGTGQKVLSPNKIRAFGPSWSLK
ncbi:MAG: PD40 domain-containing protein [Nitrospirae bacterium]|nr:PD40 domain-containing protein [Nitrospirota bacterium]